MADTSVKLDNILVRPYQVKDRGAIRSIALATAMAGEPASVFFDGNDFLADALTGYFTDREPESCFVAEDQGRVVGYIIGARDTRLMDDCFQKKILWPLFKKAFVQGLLLRRKNFLFAMQALWAVVSGKFIMPDFYRDYPATLHINLLPGVRGGGVGSRLMRTYLEFLRSQQIKGVRMATMSDAAGRFFAAQGFSRLFTSSRPYFRHITGSDVPLYIYGRSLS